MDSLQDAIAHLNEHFGRLDPPWGEVNRIVRGKVRYADPGRAGYPARCLWTEIGGTTGAWVPKVATPTSCLWNGDEEGNVSSESIHQFGSATLDETSQHFSDQAPLFAGEKTTPVLLDWEAFEPTIAESYRPGERHGG